MSDDAKAGGGSTRNWREAKVHILRPAELDGYHGVQRHTICGLTCHIDGPNDSEATTIQGTRIEIQSPFQKPTCRRCMGAKP